MTNVFQGMTRVHAGPAPDYKSADIGSVLGDQRTTVSTGQMQAAPAQTDPDFAEVPRFAPGTVVALASEYWGAMHAMPAFRFTTGDTTYGGWVRCYWIDSEGRPQTERYPQACLCEI